MGEGPGIIFPDSLHKYFPVRQPGQILHILCMEGSMSFVFQDVLYNISPHDYAILPNADFLESFSEGEGFRAIIMALSDLYVTSLAIKSDYGVIGQMSLLQNPVMRLSDEDFAICMEDMRLLQSRLQLSGHLFHDEMVGNLLLVHILDLYDIHARSHAGLKVSKRNADLMRRFMELLYNGEYMNSRALGYYSSRLFVTPHYLSEVCHKVSGRPATYWIDRFTVQHIIRMLYQNDLSISEIADRMNFSSLSYFSRYFQKMTGVSPMKYRNGAIYCRKGENGTGQHGNCLII